MELTKLLISAPVNTFEPGTEIVAISFISSEDLERIHAPNGFFREVEPDYLQRENRTSHVSGALDALEGKSLKSRESSRRSSTSVEKARQAGHSFSYEKQDGTTNHASDGLKKSSSLLALFRRTQSEPQLESSESTIQSSRA